MRISKKWVYTPCLVCGEPVGRARAELAGSARAVCKDCIRNVTEGREQLERDKNIRLRDGDDNGKD